MILTCIGHAQFLLELANGMRLVTDPYDAGCGYPVMPLEADAVLVSHHHHDHDAVESISGDRRVIDAAGVHTLATDVRVTAVPCWHDDRQGALRGANLMFLIEAEGLRVAHLGDLGHVPDEAAAAALGPVDVLMIPVGGHYTIDAATAAKVAAQLHARVVLPMHYRTRANADWPIAPVEDFLELYDNAAEHLPLLRVTAEDLCCQPQVAVLQPLSLRNDD